MPENYFCINEMSVRPIAITKYVPSVNWKGDCVGHIGADDTFFLVLEGECFLLIESEASIIRQGQLAFLPKGKMRTYTRISEPFSMYELSFSAQANGQNLMDFLHLADSHFVVDIPSKKSITDLFEKCNRIELCANTLYDIEWCTHILSIVQMYAKAHQQMHNSNQVFFQPVLNYITLHLNQSIRTEELAALLDMQTTYFIRKFKAVFGIPPQTYVCRMKIYKAMSLLASSDFSIAQISHIVGIEDVSYFSRIFRKNCGITPTEYRNAFRSGRPAYQR